VIPLSSPWLKIEPIWKKPAGVFDPRARSHCADLSLQRQTFGIRAGPGCHRSRNGWRAEPALGIKETAGALGLATSESSGCQSIITGPIPIIFDPPLIPGKG